MAQNDSVKYINVHAQVRAIKINDEKALESLYQKNFPKVESFVLKNNGNTEQAKDIFQEAFIAVWRNIQLDKFHPENETALDGYLYQVSKNKWLDYLRSGHYTKMVQLKEGLPEQPAAPMPEENEYLSLILSYFKELGESCKKVLTLFYYDNEPLKEIAVTMGWTEETARNNKYRCLQKLRELVNQNKNKIGKQ